MRHIFLSLVNFFKSLLGMNKEMDLYLPVYTAIMKQARKPALYGPKGANDDFDGRFEILVMHIYLVLRRLKADGQGRHGAGQVIFDLFFRDMDQAMREMGVGDLSVSKKIKKMAEAFYGRVAAYDEVMDDGRDKLTSVIHRNLFAEAEGDDNLLRARALAKYMTDMDISLSQLPLNQLLSRDIFLFDNEPR